MKTTAFIAYISLLSASLVNAAPVHHHKLPFFLGNQNGTKGWNESHPTSTYENTEHISIIKTVFPTTITSTDSHGQSFTISPDFTSTVTLFEEKTITPDESPISETEEPDSSSLSEFLPIPTQDIYTTDVIHGDIKTKTFKQKSRGRASSRFGGSVIYSTKVVHGKTVTLIVPPRSHPHPTPTNSHKKSHYLTESFSGKVLTTKMPKPSFPSIYYNSSLIPTETNSSTISFGSTSFMLPVSSSSSQTVQPISTTTLSTPAISNFPQ